MAAVAAATIAASLATFAPAPLASAAANVTINRVSGPTRYDTSAAIAEAKYPTGVASGNVVLATGVNFPDALAGNYLAGQLSAPILLTTPNITDPNYAKVVAALKLLLPGTTKRLFILGGTSAVGADVATDLTAKGYTITRIGGATRYDTAQLVDTQTGQVAGTGVSGNKTAIIVTGQNFPDALSGGPLAWAKKFPVVLTDGTQATLSTQATATLTADGIKNAVIMGGTAAINPGINAALAAAGITVDKQFAGVDRTDTAAQFGNYIIANYGFTNTSVILASGGAFPDALSAGPWGGDPKPLVLTEPDGSLGAFTTAFLKAINTFLATINIPGGIAAVSAATATAAQAAGTLGGVNGTFTTGPELVSATILQTVTPAQATPSNPAGTTVQYLFDEPISAGSPVAGSFGVYHSSKPNLPIVAAGAGVSGTNSSAVNAFFPTLNTVADIASDLTLAVVNTGTAGPPAATQAAVLDLQGQVNPIGSAAIGTTASATTGNGHLTAGPDLISVGGFRQACGIQSPPPALCAGAGAATNGQTAMDFTFNKAVGIQAAGIAPTVGIATASPGPAGAGTGGFLLVLNTGLEEACSTPKGTVADNGTASGGNSPGGNNTTTITVVCNPPASHPTTPLVAADVARGVVRAGAVQTIVAPLTLNVLEASPAPHTAAGNPTLVSGAFQQNVTTGCTAAGAPTPCDIALFNFDQAINGTNLVPGMFTVYDTGANQHAPISVVLSTSSANTVAAFFAGGALSGGVTGPDVGIEVAGGGASSPSATVGFNQDDEVGVANGATTTQTPGSTTGPDLVNVTQTAIKDAFGTITTYAESFTFNKPLGSAAKPWTVANGAVAHEGAFVIFDSDNTAFKCTDPAGTVIGGWSSAFPATVTCGVVSPGVVPGSGWGAASLNQQSGAVSAGVIGVVVGGTGGGPAVSTSLTGVATDNSFGYVGVSGGTGTPQFG